MDKKNIIIAVLSTVVVLGVICCIVMMCHMGGRGKESYSDRAPKMGNNMHMMPGGHMMENDDSAMSMEHMMRSMNAALEGKSGDAFDQAFLAEMIVHHQGAVEMAKLAQTQAKHQEIKDLADAIIVAQEKEIADMQNWSTTWYSQR